ncbi:hypothetical protein A2774_03870 [Candidatus Roizmanbacteria bacterium RIFCSPHIGHO2_01_FULL_39_12c]|uniref:Haloacid dehalogenase n=1 Tax=Candidatus Roizmanbacteria bacterium RIFCSPHIGHO2_01_FULL_39_12c TaxID=1802031 RepID=A0A1F7GFP7_9BACT|nr:MAG: hypothetical protein A2774_03870 [Candidatus Roizmanbacteria bacterium RIFCSPHIGHO2_01_FULL_39_12c]OGK48037.1 MAG: hypothetical protein A2963_03685 [Candidatus Roizmanbacteria bacterium RIFCSPLOWO2_01_FULL_40_13]
MAEIKFIYFDVGGVLIDYKDAFKGATSKFNIPHSEFMDVWLNNEDSVTRGKIHPQEFWHLVRKKLKIKEGADFDFLKSWIEDYRPIKTTHAIVKKFISKYKIGLLTNLYKGMTPLLREKNLIPDVAYSSIITSYETGLRKPEKEIYELATKKVNLKPEEIFFVDDQENFIEGAKKIGWNTFLFDSENVRNSTRKLKNLLDFH